jgi:hypothetical protein
LPREAGQVEFQQPAPQAPIRAAVNAGVALLDINVATVLRDNIDAAGRSDLTQALKIVTDAGIEPLPAGAVITLQPRGTQNFTLTSGTIGANGETAVKYRYDGPIQFASRKFTAQVKGAPGTATTATVTAVTIDSGAFKGTVLPAAAGVYSYPEAVRPMPTPHGLKINVNGALAGDAVELLFLGDRTLDQQTPVAGAIGLLEAEAKDLAGRVLAYPMIGKPPTRFTWLRKWDWLKWGEVVEREELIRILLGFASTDPRLRAVLAQSGIPDPERAIADIRDVSQRLEKERPETAQHARLTQAILEGARSSFVGRINNWFDQIMDRTTAEYKFRAQLVTVVAAFLVASTVQMDSIDLLRRLSSDDKLRDSLVQQAQQQQARLDEQFKQAPEKQNQDELQLAKSRRDEIETNLAKLRDPQLSVLPDHFIWQALPRARLMRNDEWNRPVRRLELVAGTAVFPIEPRWTSDLLADIEDAIRNSGAPVTLGRESRTQYKVTSKEGGPDIDGLRIRLEAGDKKAIYYTGHTPSLAVTALKTPSAAPPADLFLAVGYEPHFKIHLNALNQAGLAKALKESRAEISVTHEGGSQDIVLQAARPETRRIELQVRDEDPASNILKPTTFSGGSATYDDKLFGKAKSCFAIIGGKDVPMQSCTTESAKETLKGAGFTVSVNQLDHLVITSHRQGALQLRTVPGKSESNILNKTQELSCDGFVCMDMDLLSQSWRGMLLTWILLSLGASFWYDTLKDLLKLRSTVAKKEEAARKDRQTASAPPAQ